MNKYKSGNEKLWSLVCLFLLAYIVGVFIGINIVACIYPGVSILTVFLESLFSGMCLFMIAVGLIIE